MKSHPALRKELVERLREEIGEHPAAGDSAVAPPVAPPREKGGLKGAVKRVIRKSIAWYVDPAAHEAARQAADRVDELANRKFADIDVRFENMRDAEALAVNLELIKGEFRGLQHTLEELGMAIAPGTGLPGAGDRLAELRERLNAVERRTRRGIRDSQDLPDLENGVDTRLLPEIGTSRGVDTPGRASGPPSAVMDYVGFERRFRGDPEQLLAFLKERYLDLLVENQPVLDIGCGKGELLAALTAEGAECIGVDLDPQMVAEARNRGLEVFEQDAVAFLGSRPERSLGSIIAMHLIEHLEMRRLVELLELAATRLLPGGLFIAETPNPASLIVLGNSYVLDPTHVWPIHPSLLVFLCESAGFRDVRLRFYSPATDYHLPAIDAEDAPDWARQVSAGFEKLNQVLFGPQEYAVVAKVG